MKHIITMLVALMVMQGCATVSGYKRAVSSWVGHDVNELIQSWSYPTRTFEAPNGNTVYAYEWSSHGVTPTYTTPGNSQTTFVGNHAFTTNSGGQTFGGFSYTSWCNTYFEIDSDNKIVYWQFKGNRCLAQ